LPTLDEAGPALVVPSTHCYCFHPFIFSPSSHLPEIRSHSPHLEYSPHSPVNIRAPSLLPCLCRQQPYNRFDNSDMGGRAFGVAITLPIPLTNLVAEGVGGE
jgi:hypothetical protein